MSVERARGYSDGLRPCAQLSSTPVPPWLSSFPWKALPAAVFSLMFLQAFSLQSTAVLTLRVRLNHCAPALCHHMYWRICVPVQAALGCGADSLCGSHSLQTAIDQLPPPAASNASPLSWTIALIRGSLPCSSIPFTPPLFPSLPSSYWVFLWSGTLVSSQLVLCEIFYLLRHKFMSYKLFFQKFVCFDMLFSPPYRNCMKIYPLFF